MPALLTCRAGLLLGAALLLLAPAHAQRQLPGPPTQDPFGRPPAREVPPGRYQSHKSIWDYDTVRQQVTRVMLEVRATDGSTRQIQTWAPGVVKISYFAPGRMSVADSSVSVVQPPQLVQYETYCNQGCDGPRTEAEIKKYGPDICQGVRVYPDKLEFRVNCQLVILDKKTLAVSIYTSDDTQPVFAEAGPAYRRQPTTSPDLDTPPNRIDELPGTGVRIALQPGERLYGTGARALPLDRRGYRLELYNQAHYGYQNGEPALNVTLPVVLSSRGYLLLFDHYATGYLDLGKQRPDALEYGAEGLNSLSYFVVTGSSQAEILSRYTDLTGHQPLPPRWALGLIQSRFGYRSQAELLDVARQMRAADFPLDALVLDLYWFGGTTRQGDFRWDAQHFPDPAGMMRDLKSQGVNTILISEPYVMRTSLNDSLVRTQGLVGTTAAGRPFTVGSFWAGPASILDVFKPRARTWLWAQYQRLHAQGAAGWWSDLGEPENHPEAMHHALGTTRQVHNAYGITWAQIFQDNYQREYPDERLFNLARSGWAGMQRNSVFPWSGDISRTWSGLQAQVPIMLGMGQAGVGYMHSDAGGFGANATRDPELYTRWLQLAALCPILRPHSDQVVPPEPYTYPEPYRSIVRKYTHLRAELLPYLYTLAAENTLTGAPLMRAMDYYDYKAATRRVLLTKQQTLAQAFRLHPDTLGISAPGYQWTTFDSQPLKAELSHSRPKMPAPAPANDQYLLGAELLIAPVSIPGQRRRNVTLPYTLGGWLDFETGQPLPNGAVLGLPAPLAQVPILVRAGAVIPTATYHRNAAAFRSDTLRLRYFPSASAGYGRRFTVYEDDGQSAPALSRREFVGFQLATESADGWGMAWDKLTISKLGSYPSQPTRRMVQLEVMRAATAPTQVLLNHQPLAATAWTFDATHHLLSIMAPLGDTTAIAFPGLRLLTQPAPNLDPDAQTLLMPASRTFSQLAELRYETYLPAAAPLRIRDARGQLVRELPTNAAPGLHSLAWDGRNAQGRPVPPGYYDVELAGQHQRVVKIKE